MTVAGTWFAPILSFLSAGVLGAAGVEEIVVYPDPGTVPPWLFDALPAAVFAVLVVRSRKALVAPQVHWRHRLLLALLAGWLSGLVYRLTGDWLFGFPSYGGVLAIGALFGLFVLAPLLTQAAHHPIRIVVLVATAAMAHYMAWFIGASLFDLIPEWFGDRGEVILMAGGFGGPALAVFALLSAVAAWRAAGLRPTGRFWLALLGGSWAIGWLYQSAALDAWPAWLVTPGGASDYDIYLVFTLWYGMSSMVFSLARRQALKRPGGPDLALLAGLLLGWTWTAWSMINGAF
jgi:hypothetical protein